MKTTNLGRVARSTRKRATACGTTIVAALLIALTFFPQAARAANLRVMGQGLGTGTITGPGGIACPGSCTGTYPNGTNVTLMATPDAGSTFAGWEGSGTTVGGNRVVTMTGDQSVRAIFDLTPALNPLPASLDPTAIDAYLALAANSRVNTPARFLSVLPPEFKLNWILMTRSESLQTGTAQFPRLLLPSADGRFVFTIGLSTHGSYPGSHPLAIEYMQWDPVQKNFRFHEIILGNIPAMGSIPGAPNFPARSRMVSIDDSKCSKCHSTQNVLNRSTFPGTTGIPSGSPLLPPNEIAKSKNKPNWDSYDSWAGMLPFNRDRIYQGSVEAAAFRAIFNPWNWQSNPEVRAIIEQLQLQPAGINPGDAITRTVGGANDGHINFAFDVSPPVTTEPAPTSNGIGPNVPKSINYSFDNQVGSGTPPTVVRGGNFVVLRHSSIPTQPQGEGRGVRLFDALGGGAGSLNQTRVVDEIISHRFATGSRPIDVRPIALAIAKGTILRVNSGTNTVELVPPLAGLTIPLSFFDTRNGMQINELIAETQARAFELPRRKADIQKINLDRSLDEYLRYTSPGTPAPANGLIQQYGSATTAGATPTIQILRQEVFRRPVEPGLGFADRTGKMNAAYTDREDQSNIQKVALFRYFLEPLGVSVDKWSMNVRGRSRAYTFADVFEIPVNTYISVFIANLTASLDPAVAGSRPILRTGTAVALNPNNNAQLVEMINQTLASTVLPPANDVPKYTDIQRIWNKACIECHGGLEYPPYNNYTNDMPGFLDLSEDETPGIDRMLRSYNKTIAYTTTNPATSMIVQRVEQMDEDCPFGMMPCSGPGISKTDIETIKRWIVGTPAMGDERIYSYGDPHIKTVNGVSYDFQAGGEFVLLRGDFFELQARHTPVATTAPLGPNGHTGLTTCVSLNTAVAMEIAGHRITYQPNLNGRPDPDGLQLRIDGKLVRMSPRGIAFAPSARVLPTSEPGGIRVEAPGGTAVVVTPGWWSHYQVWYLNIDVYSARATDGLMGVIPSGNWLPAMPDGSFLGTIPSDLGARYKLLYGVFGKAWQVNDTTSLFDYAPGTSTATFSIQNWPNGESPQSCNIPMEPGGPQPLNPMTREEAAKLCTEVGDQALRELCIQDLMTTGEPGFVKTYVATTRVNGNRAPKFPVLTFPKNFELDMVQPIKFTWDAATDADGDPLIYKHYVWPVHLGPNNNDAVEITPGKDDGEGPSVEDGRLRCTLIVGLICLLIFIILFFLLRKKRPGLLVLLGILLLAAILLAYFLCGKKGTGGIAPGTGQQTMSHTVSDLEPGKAYFWKVIVEDGKGGTVESETRRFQLK